MNPTPRRCSRPSLGQGALVIIVAFLAVAFSIPDGAPTARAQDDDCGKWKWAVYHDCPGPHGCCELQFGILSRSELEKEGRTIIGAYDTEQEARQATCGQLSNVVHVSAPAGTCNGVKGDVSGDRYGLSEIVIYNYNTGDWTCPEARPDDDQDGVPNDMDSCENTSPGTLVSRSGCPCEEPPEPEPQPEPEEEEEEEKPSNARISVDPEEGPPGSEVEVRGEGFPDDAEVEIRWDAPDGELLTTVWSGGEGEFSTRFMVPEDAEEGDHRVYAVCDDYSLGRLPALVEEQAHAARGPGHQATEFSGLGGPVVQPHSAPPIVVYTPFGVRIYCVSGYVRARVRGGLPLEGVRVALTWLGPNGPQIIPHAPPGGGAPRAFVTTNAQGEYAICNAQIVIPMQNLLLAVSLNESNWGTFQVGDETTNNIVRAYFGQGGQIGANPATVNTWFSITGTADLSKDLWFEDLADDEATADVREDHALDAALVYYHTHQAMRVYRRIGAPVVPAPGGQPLQVITFSNNPTAWPGGATIFINEDDSAWNNGEAPKNREWHEFSHYMMWRVYGRMPPLHAEADDINGNGFLDADVNHGGYWYNMMSSSDAIVEGFAVFMAMVIADQMEQDGEIYMNDHVPPYIYPIGTGAYQPAMCNLEINYPQNRLLSLPADYRRGFYDQLSGAQRANAAEKPRPWRAIADEDLSVASTLWDVYDGQSGGDQDEISVDLQALWPVWAGAYQVPQYFAAPTVGGFLGDAFTYGSTANPSRW
ncbi:MAG: hypothetical protein PVH80_08625, partial [Anaerolineae bacterium]